MPSTVCDQYSTWLGIPPSAHRRCVLWVGASTTPVLGGFAHCRAFAQRVLHHPPGCGVRTLRLPTRSYSTMARNRSPPRCGGMTNIAHSSTHSKSCATRGPALCIPSQGSFYHPADRVAQATPAAAARFHEDHRRFPPAAYEENSLVWSGNQWRQLSPDERSQLLGVPVAATHAVRGSQDQRTKTRNSLLGNGFPPSQCHGLAVLAFPPIMAAKLIPQPLDFEETSLAERLSHTVWSPGRLANMPGLLTYADVCKELRATFPFLEETNPVWGTTAQRLMACELSALQAYPMWRRLRQEPWTLLGPTPVWGRERTAIYAGLTGQRYASNSTKGLDHLLPPGLGKGGTHQSFLSASFTFCSQPMAGARCGLCHPSSGNMATSSPAVGRETPAHLADSGTSCATHWKWRCPPFDARALGRWQL